MMMRYTWPPLKEMTAMASYTEEGSPQVSAGQFCR
jgi:hypothetical protein